MKRAVETIRAKSEIGKSPELVDSEYKFDPIIADDVANLERLGYVERSVNKIDDRLYDFQITEKLRNSKLLTKDELRRIDQSGGYTHIPKETYESVIERKPIKTTEEYNAHVRQEIDKAIDKSPEAV